MKKIGILIPVTSRKTNWKKVEETYLCTHFIPSFNNTKCNSYEYVIYLGFDNCDRIYDNKDNQKIIEDMLNDEVKFINFNDINKGHLTKMWNYLFDIAFNENCEYFYQCGDDIYFYTKGWTTKCVEILDKNNGIGITGPININGKRSILIQTFVSRLHKTIFGYYFPEEIMNYYCDDWINFVYKNNRTYKLVDYKIVNASCKGTGERYKPYRKFDRNKIFNNGRFIFKNYFRQLKKD